MNNSLDVLKSIYKPFRYTLKGSATILETTSGNFVIKEKTKDLRELFNYLNSRNFDNYPELIDDSRNDVNVFKFIEDTKMPIEQKAQDLINIVANLHNKTSFFKDTTEDSYKSIYDNIYNNIAYYKKQNNNYYNKFFEEIYMSPSQYLFMRNYSKIMANLNFCQSELDKWYENVKNETKTRVTLVHNNIQLDHFIKGNRDYLISWDNATIDSPILDLINFYHHNFFDVNFENLFEIYFSRFNLNESEKKLLFLMITIPPKITFDKEEFRSCLNIRKNLDYIFKTEKLIRPYYAEKHEE